jgi:hypothetical protein
MLILAELHQKEINYDSNNYPCLLPDKEKEVETQSLPLMIKCFSKVPLQKNKGKKRFYALPVFKIMDL